MRWVSWEELSTLGADGDTLGPDPGLLRALEKARRITHRQA
jgi:hypothetical protein